MIEDTINQPGGKAGVKPGQVNTLWQKNLTVLQIRDITSMKGVGEKCTHVIMLENSLTGNCKA